VGSPQRAFARNFAESDSGDAIRLNLDRALALVSGRALTWHETSAAHAGTYALNETAMRQQIGDVVLGRKDIGVAAYHLSVVVDDAAQGITHVIRGEDLLETTPIHRLLQAMLELPVPVWHHHRLVRDETGKRLAKRSDAFAIRNYREAGRTPDDVWRMADTRRV